MAANTCAKVNAQFPELEILQTFHSTPTQMEKLMQIIESKQEVEVVVNGCYGGFRLSEKGMRRYADLSGNPMPAYRLYNEYVRHDPILVQVVKKLGADANGKYADLQLDTVPIHLLSYYSLDEYDGEEHIQLHQNHFKQYIVGKIACSAFENDSKEALLKKMEMIRYIHSVKWNVT